MELISKLYFMIILFLLPIFLLAHPFPINNNNKNKTYLFREYIGAEFNNVKFSDVPINPGVQFHFILSFAIDYTAKTLTSLPNPTDGKFDAYWDTDNFSPAQVVAIKRAHPNVKVVLCLGGDTIDNSSVYFSPLSTVDSWVQNAVKSLTRIIKKYHLDGIDIDYEHFKANDTGMFVECIGRLIRTLKVRKVISFASIAPYADEEIQARYMALWRDYGGVIDYVNFQFYAYDTGSSVKQFLGYFREQRLNYGGGKMLASFISDGSGGWAPNNTEFYAACEGLKEEGSLYGIFVWCADESKAFEFKYERLYQKLLAC